MLREICDVFKEAYRRGWITTRDGNASYRRPEQDWFYVTPSGVRKNELVPDMCIKLDINESGTSRDRWVEQNDGLIKQSLNRSLKPTGELPMHWLLQRHVHGERHSRVVLHLHPTHVIALTRRMVTLNEDRDLVDHWSLKRLAEVYPEIFRYTRVGDIIGYVPPISAELGDAVARAMLKSPPSSALTCDVVALDAHGAVSVGTDPWEAFEHIERLNHICEIALLAGEVK